MSRAKTYLSGCSDSSRVVYFPVPGQNTFTQRPRYVGYYECDDKVIINGNLNEVVACGSVITKKQGLTIAREMCNKAKVKFRHPHNVPNVNGQTITGVS